jgi:hypothetical protein
MRLAPCVLTVVLAGAMAATVAGCAGPNYRDGYSSSPGYNPGYSSNPGRSPNNAYTPQYSNETPASRYGYNSQGDYYRNYGGTYHPGPERNCPGC